MKRRSIICACGGITLGNTVPAFAQSESRMRRIVFFEPSGPGVFDTHLAAFREGMTQLRWMEGRDYVIDSRVVNGLAQPESVPGIIDALLVSRPDLVLTSGIRPTRLLAQRTRTIPIMAPVINGEPTADPFIASMARPGANVTGLSTFTSDLAPKRLQLLKEAFLRISHIGLLYERASSAGNALHLKAIEDAALRLGMRITLMELAQVADFEAAFKLGAERGVQAYLTATSPLIALAGRTIREYMQRARLPAMFDGIQFAEAGGLMAYGASWKDNFRRAAIQVDKIFKGANPGDLPIEQPTKFELVVNLKTARAMELTIPGSFLLRADRVIE